MVYVGHNLVYMLVIKRKGEYVTFKDSLCVATLGRDIQSVNACIESKANEWIDIIHAGQLSVVAC